jgi:hypothetical protein
VFNFIPLLTWECASANPGISLRLWSEEGQDGDDNHGTGRGSKSRAASVESCGKALTEVSIMNIK